MVVLHKKKKTTLLSFWKCRNPKLHPRPVEMSSTVWFLSAKMYLSQRDQLPCRSDTNRHNKTPIIRSCKHKPNRTMDWTEGHSAGLHHTKCLSAQTWASKLHVHHVSASEIQVSKAGTPRPDNAMESRPTTL